MTPDLSVVMPLHGGEQYLRATLASLAAERPEGVRILAYDSSPDTAANAAVVADFAGDLDIAYVAVPTLKPWQAKVNRGFDEAGTDHVAILHQDDLWLPGHLAAVRSAMAAHPAAGLSIGPSRFIDSTGGAAGMWHLPFPAGLVEGRDFFAKAIVQNTIAVPSAVYRRDAWLAAGGMDEALWYTPDWDIYLHLARLGAVVVRPQATTAFRLHGGSLTVTGSADAADFRRQLEIVLHRHAALWQLDPGSPLARRAQLSLDLNCAMAGAAGGKFAGLLPALWRMARLGPAGLGSFLDETRLADRVMARLPLLLR
ncbi:MAG: glycosyltransferase family 2 protein [Novosphingobium sp.]